MVRTTSDSGFGVSSTLPARKRQAVATTYFEGNIRMRELKG
jgi:hypothetical protein